jgi:butyryl-CoA dehydrogenase
MDFEFDEEHELFQKSLEKFVENEVLPVAQEIDEKGKFPHELFKKAGGLGYYGMRYPAEYGGTDGDNIMFCILCEELARGSLSFAAGVMMQAMQSTVRRTGQRFIELCGGSDDAGDAEHPFSIQSRDRGAEAETNRTCAQRREDRSIRHDRTGFRV